MGRLERSAEQCVPQLEPESRKQFTNGHVAPELSTVLPTHLNGHSNGHAHIPLDQHERRPLAILEVHPLGFHWNGTQFIACTIPDSPNVRALATHPRVAMTIDTNTFRRTSYWCAARRRWSWWTAYRRSSSRRRRSRSDPSKCQRSKRRYARSISRWCASPSSRFGRSCSTSKRVFRRQSKTS